MTNARKILVLALMAAAVALLYPGVTQPVLTVTGHIEKSEIAELGIDLIAGPDADSQTTHMLQMMSSMLGLDQVEGKLEAYNSSRSIWGTAEELARTGNLLVACLIVLFSVIIPIFKLLLQAVALYLDDVRLRRPLVRLNGVLSKWSMADVYVMAMLVAYMAGSASEHMGELLIMDARLEPGFYFFLGYCLLAIASSGLIIRAAEDASEVAA